jgi:hydroxypyruvate isomerase
MKSNPRAQPLTPIKQSVCRWCYDGISLATLAEHAAAIGLKGIDLVEPAQWEILRRHGLVGTMTPSHSITAGLSDPANHIDCLMKIRNAIEATAAAGFPNVICFSGNRTAKISDRDGLKNCAKAIKRVLRLAEKRKVTLCMELLNSKLNHRGYMCDRTEWGAELAKRIDSPRFKLLYDIYHMQVQEGDVIATIKKHAGVIGHYHTAGVPGRHEIDRGQELNYPAIVRAIAETGFDGYLAHEFIPAGDPLNSLRQAVQICQL